MELTTLQEQVKEKAIKELKSEPWFSGIVLNDFPTDSEIESDFDGSVQSVMCETAYWEAPNCGF